MLLLRSIILYKFCATLARVSCVKKTQTSLRKCKKYTLTFVKKTFLLFVRGKFDLTLRARYSIYMDTSTQQPPTNMPKTHESYTLHITQANAPLTSISFSTLDKQQTLAQILWLSGKLTPPPLCSGLGRCGACKVRFHTAPPLVTESERKILPPQEHSAGWRLACRHTVQSLLAQAHATMPTFAATGIIELEVPTYAAKYKTLEQQENKHCTKHEQAPLPAKLAVDLGTTSLCWQLISLEGAVLTQGSMLNPQMGAGADVISRLQYAMHAQGKKTLAALVSTALQNIITSLPDYTIEEICLAANTAMTAILLEKDITSLAYAPYALPLQGNSTAHIQHLPPMYIPVQLAPFVGGDISAGYAYFLAKQKANKHVDYPFILADLGTNGEFILALSPEKAYITSVPMGPSLEGIGLAHGHMADASPGIVNAVQLGAQGLIPQTIAHDAPQKLCGTGYLSLLHALLKVGVLTTHGVFTANAAHLRSPFAKKIAQQLMLQEEEQRLQLWPALSNTPMWLSAMDVEEILKVKAAFSLAMSYLLKHAGLAPSAVKHIYLAGAMGTYVNVQDLEGLGFVPQGMGPRISPVGNLALEGAKFLLLDTTLRQELLQWSKTCSLVNLTEDEHFTEKFLQHMSFSFIG